PGSERPGSILLPRYVPVDPPQRWSGDRALMPSPCHDLGANRFSCSPEPGTQRRGLVVPGPAAEPTHAVEAHAHFRMIAEVDELFLGADPAAAPASVLDGLADRCLSLG